MSNNHQVHNADWKKYIQHFQLLSETISLAEKLQQDFNSLQFKPGQLSAKKAVANYLLIKSYKTVGAIIILCKGGYQEDAFALLRSLIENAINYLWIMNDPSDESPSRYMADDILQKKLYIENRMKIPFHSKEVAEDTAAVYLDICKRFEAIEKKYGTKGGFHWSNESLERMAVKVGVGEIYYTYYSPCSWFCHGKVSSSPMYVIRDEAGTTFKSIPSYDRVGEILIPTAELFLKILEAFCSLYDFHYSSEITECKSKLVELQKIS